MFGDFLPEFSTPTLASYRNFDYLNSIIVFCTFALSKSGEDVEECYENPSTRALRS